jgi:hypothetical protein
MDVMDAAAKAGTLSTPEPSAATALRLVDELERLGAKVDVVLPDGTHRYWSTHCRHDTPESHEACSAKQLTGRAAVRVSERGTWAPRTVGIPRKPAQCKTCEAPCVCPCHREAQR